MPRFFHDTVPALPAEVLAEVDAAWERAHDLVADELELHFDVSVSGRVRGELRDACGGELVARLSAAEALALACGDAELALAA
ncbi:hypothetical protein DVA67_024155 [Solirubrobacter sp. CPCC 204708]|uniref:Uncharacterized protein n=1 Tax=Solirubrobacter deserti TaxID=2282478 RepID=A0ABT4RKT1_9ACTN|nr:hypothetical protein [Solirubrobacter deserti]MBE2319090.1 hypothetical protein [Solirubrobacter deserti]MDA0139169.1 hypothetical protein [Solirubrobacter deserti]